MMIASRSPLESASIGDASFHVTDADGSSRTIMDSNSTSAPLIPENIKWESAKKQALALPSGLHLYLWQILHQNEIIFTLHVEFADTMPTSTDSTGPSGGVSHGTE